MPNNQKLSVQEFLDAAGTNNLPILLRYIEENKDYPAAVYVADNEGWIALMLAANNGHADVIHILLAVPGMNVNASNEYGSALMFASGHGHVAAVQALLDSPDIDKNAAQQGTGYNALMCAAAEGCVTSINALLAAPGINTNATNHFGQTALIIAAAFNQLDAINALLSTPDLDLAAEDNDRETAAQIIRRYGHDEIANLIEARINKQQLYVTAATAELLASKHIPKDAGRNVSRFLSAKDANALGKVNKAVRKAGKDATQLKKKTDHQGESEGKPASFSPRKP